LLVAHAQAHSWDNAVRGVLEEFEHVVGRGRPAETPASRLVEPGPRGPR
jgi:hypothetical protein